MGRHTGRRLQQFEQGREARRTGQGRLCDVAVKLSLNGQRPRVYFSGEEVKPGLFAARVYMTNAVVFTSSAVEDRDGRWVETWNFSLTEKNSDTLIACFSRVVNNLDVTVAKDDSKFGLLAVGNFTERRIRLAD